MFNLNLVLTKVSGPAKDLSLFLTRIMLALVFLFPGIEKWKNMEGTIYWYDSLGIPFPEFNAYLSASVEVIGVAFLTLGFLARIISIPLITTLIVAIKTVHWDNGWYTIGQSTLNEDVQKRVSMARDILQEHGNYEWLTESGSFVILQNGWENPIIYITMLTIIFAFGPGRLSIDYQFFNKKLK